MTEPAVLFDAVWKKFRRGELHDSLRDLVPALVKRMVGRGRRRDRLEQGDFWALSDVSFEVAPGTALGIIGPNGAGKSTVLKLLTRILRPNRGRCEVRGRVGALIEVAAGFHPDLTGRENIFLQGVIMGMRRAEIATRFDRIVDFSGVSDFIDTPVKRYSSGMNARLGFAVAAHLDPDVLIVDEVLAVGDAGYQKKAFDRMAEIVRSGIPVVVVSHQLDRIASLCNRAILLDQGRVISAGSPAECIGDYLGGKIGGNGTMSADAPIEIRSISVESDQPVPSGEYVTLRVVAHVHSVREAIEGISFRLISADTGRILYASGSAHHGAPVTEPGRVELELALQMNVPDGVYAVESLIWDGQTASEVAKGPTTLVRVSPGPRFWGSVQLNPRVCVITSCVSPLPTASAPR